MGLTVSSGSNGGTLRMGTNTGGMQAGTGIKLQGGSGKNLQGGSAGMLNTTYNPQPQTVNPYNVYTGGSVAGATTTGGGGGGGGYYAAPAPPPDPYAKYGGRAAYDRLVDGFSKQKDTIFDTSLDAARNSGISMRLSILDLLDSIRTGQRTVDNRGINNELAKQRGTSDIYSSMNRGIKSGAVTLANKNAGDSSAARAIADAYGDIGRRQLSDVGNQYALENIEVADAQTDLNRQRAGGLRRIQGSREQSVNTIVAEANNKLAALDAAMAEADLPDRIAIDAEKNRIRTQVLERLSGYDNDLGKINQVKAMDNNRRIAEASRRAKMGLAPEDAFEFTDEMPLSLEGTGPVASELPIFTIRNNEED